MEKRYQIFVSSTYEDLQKERQEIMHALLELDCIPAGMELFPAANEEQWSLIKKVIDDCDYYIVVIGGRYGSLNSDGISYTEMEYKYALNIGKPIIAFLHKKPGDISSDKTEQTDEGKKKLKEFRLLCENKMCKYWTSSEDLGSVVSRSIIKLIKNNPAIGWIKANFMANKDAIEEINNLRKKVYDLEKELSISKAAPPKGTDGLSQGDDKFEITFQVELKLDELDELNLLLEGTNIHNKNLKCESSWNEIFSFISPVMIDEASNYTLYSLLNNFVMEKNHLILLQKYSAKQISNYKINENDFQTIIIQLRALGLIIQSKKNRNYNDISETFWTLTDYGDNLMTNLRAIKK